ncbi:thioesterase II family protein [Ensifer sp. YR511]|uniref:thioesterase II family protein n=1 Tax=Ensifer sp. YR511 TaxID=1855294 RepID=UPI00088B6F46|nr:alpha/beta fold hydrolase [Ensifer sp. YR511]SDN02899.1 Surfactin synthase thioesterase subunit [Ensifer sp. YR511]
MIRTQSPFARSPSPWLSYVTRRENARLRLFCLPFAGGGAEFYRDWATMLLDDVEIWPVQLPGRSTRMREPAIDDMALLVSMLSDAIAPYLSDTPFVFFGHSMGALISYELTHRLRAMGLPTPIALVLSGRSAPSHPIGRHKHMLPDQDLIEELKRFDGTPREVLDAPEFLALVLPVLRNDLKLLETYAFDVNRTPLNIPLFVSGGDADGLVSVESLAGWSEVSTGQTEARIWEGGHFFLTKRKDAFLSALSSTLENVLIADRQRQLVTKSTRM